MSKYEKYKKELISIRTTDEERRYLNEIEARINRIENAGGYAGISKREFVMKVDEIIECQPNPITP